MNAKQIEQLNHYERSKFFWDLVEKKLDSTARTVLTLDSFHQWNCLIVTTRDLTLSVAKLDAFVQLLKNMGFDVDVLFKKHPQDTSTLILQLQVIS